MRIDWDGLVYEAVRVAQGKVRLDYYVRDGFRKGQVFEVKDLKGQSIYGTIKRIAS